MNAETLAKKLNGRDYRKEITVEEQHEAENCGLVVVFGASDDLMEFRGALNDEISAWDGVSAFVNEYGLVINDCGDEFCPYHAIKKEEARVVEAVWCPRDSDGNTYASWLMKTDMPHSEFDIIEDGDLYCRGLVFCLADAKAKN